MECKVCGTVNVDDAIFCKQCGVRLDGKKTCKICGAENDYDARFCNKCGNVFVGGTTSTATVASESQEITLEAAKPSNWKRILEIIGWACAMTGLFFSFLFTFFVGFDVKVNGAESGISVSLGQNRNLFYYLSDAYKNFDTAIESLSEYQFAMTYIPLFLGTIISVGLLVAVTTMSIVAVVRFVKFVRGKSDRDFAKLTIATYLVFVMGSLMLFGLNYISASSTMLGVFVNVYYVLNSATVAGIILGGICMFVFVAMRVAVKGKQIAAKDNILRIIFGGVALVVCGVLLGVLPTGAISGIDDSSKISISFFNGLSVFYGTEDLPIGELVVGVIAHLTQIVMIIMVNVILLNQVLSNIITKRKPILGLSIATLVLAVLYFICAWYFSFLAFQNELDSVTVLYATPIVILLFSVVNLGASITQIAMNKKTQTVEAPEVATVSAE